MTQRSQTQNFRLFIEQIFRLQEKNRRIPKTVGIERAFLPHHICYMRAVFALRSSSLCGPLRLCDLCARCYDLGRPYQYGGLQNNRIEIHETGTGGGSFMLTSEVSLKLNKSARK